MADRAVFFIDGNNWYHSLKDACVPNVGELDYVKICEKLAGTARNWIATRYYIGRVNQASAPQMYADQRRFVSRLTSDPRFTAYFGRIEMRKERSKLSAILLEYLANLKTPLDPVVRRELEYLATSHTTEVVYGEKAVDVHLAVDMVVMAERNEYDCAYLLTADGDFTPAVAAVRAMGKRVYAASPATGAQLGAAVNTYIPLKRVWFNDCYYGQ